MNKNDKEIKQNSESDAENSSDSIDPKRRRIAGFGLSAPVIMTLASRPVLAKQCSGSVLASGNLSDPVNMGSCGACREDQWFNASASVWGGLGVDPSSARCEDLFNVPKVKDKNGIMQLIFSATILDALQANVVIPSGIRFKDQYGNKVKASTGKAQLRSCACIFTAAVMNASYTATAVNFPWTPAQVAMNCDAVLVLTGSKSNKLNIDAVTGLANTLLGAFNNGSSCALP